MARPSLFTDERVKEAIIQIALLGHKDTEICKIVSIGESTLNEWKLKDAEFAESLKEAKIKSDADVEKSLRKRAMGYDVVETLVDKKGEQFQTNKHIPPDTTACIFWLKNRQSERWRDTHEVKSDVNHNYNLKVDYSIYGISESEAERIADGIISSRTKTAEVS